MATADKLTTVAENVPKVYHAGQMNVVENAECLKGSKTDTAILLDDISPVSHEMGVKVRGKNLFDISKIQNTTQTDTQKIIQNNDGTLTVYGTVVNSKKTLRGLCPSLKVGDEAMLSFRLVNSGTDTKEMGYIYILGVNMSWKSGTVKVITDGILDGLVYLYCRYYNQPTEIATGTISEFQIELGTTATDYTPYVPDLTAVKVIKSDSSGETVAEYTPNADGTVEGVTSLYPNTTLMTKTDGVLIDCEYYKDVDKAFDELTQAMTEHL